jgi:GAF domain-containing protein
LTEADGAPVRDTDARFDALIQPATYPDGAELQFMPIQLCQAAVRVLAIDGAAISIRLDIDVSVPIGADDRDAAAAEQLQFTLGQGPCLESALSGKSVFVPDLEQAGPSQAWPVYVSEITRRTPYRAVFCFPLTLVGLTLGTLNLYRRSAGQSLSKDEIAAVHHITSRIATDLHAAGMFDITDRETNHEWMDSASARRRHQVSVAQGMTMQTNNVTAPVALALLRARAYASNRLLDDVAEDVIGYRLPPPDLRA